MRIATFVVLFCVSATAAAHSQAQDIVPSLPESPEANYEMGQQFAECSAMFKLFAAVSEQAGKEATQEWAQNVAGGWQVGALFFVVQGLEPNQRRNATEVTNSIIDLKFTELAARVEMNVDAGADQITAEYKSKCEPLIPLQKSLIDVLRRNNFGLE